MGRDRKGAKPPQHNSPDQYLTEDERALWEYAARDLEPLKKRKGYVHDAGDAERKVSARKPKTADHASRQRTAPQSQERAPVAKASSKTPPPLSGIDRRRARQIGSGRIAIAAKIDLHGMHQSEAHAALRRFLFSAHAKDCRWVLVITGKGSAIHADADEFAGDSYGRSEPGVLRRNVPRWLNEPDLRAVVVSYTSASPRHGGEGALYVQLRKRGGPQNDVK